MTAPAICYTPCGFALAAEGRQLWQHGPTRNRSVHELESDSVQKIFEMETKQAVFAYTLVGDIASRDRSFDLDVELRNELAVLRGERFSTGPLFIEALSIKLENAIERAKRERRIEDYPASEISFLGYFNGDPCWRNIRLSRYGERMVRQVTPQELYPGLFFATGSPLIGKLICCGDQRFAQYARPPKGDLTLQEAAVLVRGYIEACCSPLALELDPENCRHIGGHIHVATVTPLGGSLISRIRNWLGPSAHRQAPGFHWLEPPI